MRTGDSFIIASCSPHYPQLFPNFSHPITQSIALELNAFVDLVDVRIRLRAPATGCDVPIDYPYYCLYSP
jgi:hypothetical protein